MTYSVEEEINIFLLSGDGKARITEVTVWEYVFN